MDDAMTRDRALLEGLAARLNRNAGELPEAMAFLMREEAQAITAALAASPPAREEAPGEGAREDSPITAAIRAKLARVKATTYSPGTPAERMKDGKLHGLNTALAIAMVEDERALRARTSEPEAGAVVVKAICQHCHRATVVPPETLALAHPAPATADKLRVAKEALERIADLKTAAPVAAARQALATLNEEG